MHFIVFDGFNLNSKLNSSNKHSHAGHGKSIILKIIIKFYDKTALSEEKNTL